MPDKDLKKYLSFH